MTAYGFQILEVLHSFGGYNVDADRITVLKDGGDVDRGSYIERAVHEGFPECEPGREYVLFLERNVALDEWVPAFGPDSARWTSRVHVSIHRARRQ